MKKIILTSILLFMLLRSIGQISYFIEGGPSISRIVGRDSRNYSGYLGYYLGTGVEKIISKPVGISLSIFYGTRGFKSENTTVTDIRLYTEKDSVKQSTLCFPLLAIYHFKKISIVFGYQMEVLLKSKQEGKKIVTNNGGIPFYSVTNYDDKYRFAKTESGLTLGLNVKIINNLDMSFKFILASKAISPGYLWNYFGNYQIGIVKRFGESSGIKRVNKDKSNQDREINTSHSIDTKQNVSIAMKKFGESSGINSVNKDTSNQNREINTPYTIDTKQNVRLVEFRRIGEGSKVIIRIKKHEMGSIIISDLSFEGSSGILQNVNKDLIMDYVLFPFKGVLKYNFETLGSQNPNVLFSFAIYQSGLWEISIYN